MGLMDRDYYREKVRDIERGNKDKKKYLVIAIIALLLAGLLFLF